ncbi:hypothetical protein H3966_10690 [Staphylococcus epidermidis]|uniref:hypothetical protein n=1 Tax=Staphylococcus epidermidis TaxID=1282 RepID=UPI00051664D3|nr:hypothetical protein [Staphylococcus epidermidis]MBF2226252.1 hypothetical protein [Staphylococcus epidermidis]MCG2202279.1 hypothetical protein [Staphylococcus epidermidis]MDH8871427.1 hypothetical protein [Staphylococcus epidermidis]OXE94539.1 hypothetical protein ATC33_00005 [Staphylococcus epidermidis]
MDIIIDIINCMFLNMKDGIFFLYSNFSFPLLFLVTILIFREEISSVLTRIKTIKYSGSAGEVSFILNNIKQLGDDMESLKNSQIRRYGEEVLKTGHFGSGAQDDEDEEKYYFNLIHLSNLTGRELAEKGPFKTIENLYKAYKFFEKNYSNIEDRSAGIIKEIYDNTVELKKKGGFLLDEAFVYEYRSFIEITLRGLEFANTDEIKND